MIFCSRCNKNYPSPVDCGSPGCNYPEYYDTMHARFRGTPPSKYFCSLIGGINSGKTYYLLALLDILLEPDDYTAALMNKFGIANIEMIDPGSNDLQNELIALCRHGQLPLTVKGVLGFFNLIITLENDVVYEVVLFNSSGEKIEDQYESLRYKNNAHELQGAVILYFLDPREDSQINKVLDFQKAEASTNLKLTNFTFKMMQALYNGVQSIPNPFAVCISKFDLLLHRIPDDVPQNPFIEAHSSDFFGDIASTSEKLKSFLQERSQTVKPKELETKFRSLGFFAIAPFGSDEKPAYWAKRSPKGILAPFFWALKERQIIKEEDGTY